MPKMPQYPRCIHHHRTLSGRIRRCGRAAQKKGLYCAHHTTNNAPDSVEETQRIQKYKALRNEIAARETT